MISTACQLKRYAEFWSPSIPGPVSQGADLKSDWEGKTMSPADNNHRSSTTNTTPSATSNKPKSKTGDTMAYTDPSTPSKVSQIAFPCFPEDV